MKNSFFFAAYYRLKKTNNKLDSFQKTDCQPASAAQWLPTNASSQNIENNDDIH